MSNLERERRGHDRKSLAMQVVVKGRESSEVFWKETTNIINVSRIGANFNLQKECKTGCIVSLILKMPKNLRCYDQDKKLYRIWGLVQYCSPITHEDKPGYQIGVAFVGKHAPESYANDPLRSYRVSGMDSDGFWHIGETKTPFTTRAHHRFVRSFPVHLAHIDQDGEETAVDVRAITENVCAGGAAVYSNLELDTGECVKFTSEDHDFTSICIVRNRQILKGEGAILNLEFSEAEFPVRSFISANGDEEESEDLEELDENDDSRDTEEPEGDSEGVELENAEEHDGEETSEDVDENDAAESDEEE